MEGVFLHVLADTLGSVFVIISTLLIQWFGWQWSDPLCSLILSVLIVGSVYPLLKSSGSVLLQSIPKEIQSELDHILQEVLNINGVRSYSNIHLWQLKSDTNVASICLQVEDSANEQIVRQTAKQIFKKFDITQAAIQVEKREFDVQMSSFFPNYRPSAQIDRASFVPKENHSHSHHGHSHGSGNDKPCTDNHSQHGHSHDVPNHTAIGMNGALQHSHHHH